MDGLYELSITKIESHKRTDTRWISQKTTYDKGAAYVVVHFSAQVVPYLSELKSRFTNYTMKQVPGLTSPYTIRLLEMLMRREGSGFFKITLDDLREHMVHNKAFNKFDKKDVLKEITKKWIAGTPFHQLFRIADNNKCKLGKGKRPRKVKIDNIIDICEGGLAYDGALLVSALCEFVEMLEREGTGDTINRLQLFQKRLKYGLPTQTTIALYELGFSDRVIAQDIAASLNLDATQQKDLVKALKKDREGARALMEK